MRCFANRPEVNSYNNVVVHPLTTLSVLLKFAQLFVRYFAKITKEQLHCCPSFAYI